MAEIVELQPKRETDKEFSFFRNELVPSPLKADADFMMSANDNASHIRNTSESALSNNAPLQSNKKRLNLALLPCNDAERESLGSSISALTEEPQNALQTTGNEGQANQHQLKQGLNTARTESGDSNNYTYSESGYNPTGSLRQTIST
jgi:hypothetical protein